MEKDKYAGMTVNERLLCDNLLHDFDRAVAEKDVAKVIAILKKIELKEISIIPILESLNLDYKKYY